MKGMPLLKGKQAEEVGMSASKGFRTSAARPSSERPSG